ncbi:hypothetical protein NDU88_007168 [Pleurodeles waltl]|uniref:Uncharacterized protein n=1 Tax=Pleurodeles waltl TaxID=8319 RepID=A0AAV7NW04_PLEWA|nr:hypothetical protein NDU88_007168 [Pleurodeles waltl]
MRSSLLPGTEEGTLTDYAGTVLYLELSSPRPVFSPGQVNSAGEEGKLRGVTPCAGYRRLILGLCGATNSGSYPRHRRVPPGPRGTSCTQGPVPCTPGHQRLSGGATFIPARTLVSVTGAGECALFVLPLHALAGVREVSPLSICSSTGSRPSGARRNVPSAWIPRGIGPSRTALHTSLPPPPPKRECLSPARGVGSVSDAAAFIRVSGCRGVLPEAARVSSALPTPLTTSGFAAGGACSPTPRGRLTARLAVSPPLPVPVAAVLHCFHFRRERRGAPARSVPPPQSTARHLSSVRVWGAAPILRVNLNPQDCKESSWAQSLIFSKQYSKLTHESNEGGQRILALPRALGAEKEEIIDQLVNGQIGPRHLSEDPFEKGAELLKVGTEY